MVFVFSFHGDGAMQYIMTHPSPTRWSHWSIAHQQHGAAVCSVSLWCCLLSMLGPPAVKALHGGRWGGRRDERPPATPNEVVRPPVPRFECKKAHIREKINTPVQRTADNARNKFIHMLLDQTLASHYNPSTVCKYDSILTNTSPHVPSMQYSA